ncbi:unnamed protein product [Fusarium equiseti]|uniref:F-box domain-containing protein n=1 Tax=Fusarium equiseti TaxID=61235 RepID=A0A8J2NM07_FUSEQ|nr:unnamed protein product [Fusarium equiseti]
MSIVQPIFRDEPFLLDNDDWDSVQHIEWELDANFFTGCKPRPTTPLNKAVADHQITLARAAALIIRISLNNIPADVPDFDPASLTGYRKQLFQWMNTYNASPASKLLLGDVTMAVTIEVLSSLPKMSAEGEILAKIGPNLGGILQGTVDPISVLTADDKIYRMQDDMELIQKMREHLGDYLSCFATKEAPISILEIGASTCNSTKTIIGAFSGQKNVSYTITDRSLSVLVQIKPSQTVQVNLKALDINEDPLDQGFSPESFDVILVNNILYTANSLSRVLGNTRKLLAPGGTLLLVGLSNMSPAYNLIFGMNENMWSDGSYEQLEYPSVSEWNAILQSNSFSMLEPATKTFDHIGQSSYCVVSTAITTTRNLMVNILPDKEGKLFSFAHQLSTALIETNTASTISPTLSDEISSRFIYTVLDDGSSSLAEYQNFVKANNVLWISMSTNDVKFRDTGILKRFARTAREANEKLKLVILEIKQEFPEYPELLKVVTRIIQVSFQEDRGTRTELEYKVWSGYKMPSALPPDFLSLPSTNINNHNRTLPVFYQLQQHKSEMPTTSREQYSALRYGSTSLECLHRYDFTDNWAPAPETMHNLFILTTSSFNNVNVPTANSDKGAFPLFKLPPEIISYILLELDIASLRWFSQSSRQARHVTIELPQYRQVVQHGPEAIKAIVQAGLSDRFSYRKFRRALIQ